MKSIPLALALVIGLALPSYSSPPSQKMYDATAKMLLLSRGAGWVTHSPVIASYQEREAEEFIAGESNIILSSDYLDPIVQKLRLDHTWAERFHSFKNTLSKREAIEHLRSVVRIEFPQGNEIFDKISYGGLWYILWKPIEVRITASSEVPQESADIANAIAENYKATRDQEETDRNNRGLNSLKEQIAEQQKAVDVAKAAVGRDASAQGALNRQQALLDAFNVRHKQLMEDDKLVESPVRIISRAVAPPE